MAERKKVSIIGPTKIISGKDKSMVEFAVGGGSDKDKKLAMQELADMLGGELLEEIPLGRDNRTDSPSNFTTGFDSKHPKRATWEPSPIWRRNRPGKTDD